MTALLQPGDALTDRIRDRARQLGFDDCRFTTADPPASAPHFEAWLDRGFHGAMAYLERTRLKRCDPRIVLASARSVVVVAASYGSDRSGAGGGGIARYAQSADYHTVLGGALCRLAEAICELAGPGARALWYIDTGPVLERDLAQRSGLGFIGKHTNLIHRRLGNWICLGEILTTAELAPDAAEPNRCGTCERCLGACPTRAIVAPFQLDARRCLSYLTIEWKGGIPSAYRDALGRRIFGCDDCLAACPWNRFAREGALMRSAARADLRDLDLPALLELDAAGFRRRFGGTPVERLKRRGLRRNVCVALGNTPLAQVPPALLQAAADPEPMIAEHARWAMAKIRARMAAPGAIGPAPK
jgi:epoxyqueuosine reductase